MRLFGLDISLARKGGTLSIDQVIKRLEAIRDTVSGINITPETALASPTVHAIDTAISRRLSTLPIYVLQKSTSNGRTKKERLPNHPVQKLLNRPNDNETRTSYWLDAVSWLLRYNRFYAFKARGKTGPIRRLDPIAPSAVEVKQNADRSLSYEVRLEGGGKVKYQRSEMHHARGRSTRGIDGESPFVHIAETVALEIAAERFGAAFFGNGAMPLMVFKYIQGTGGHKTKEERDEFIQNFREEYGQGKRFRAMIMPKGMEMMDPVPLENDKAQMIETRRYQRTVIAGALGVPPWFVGDLERGNFANIEHQSLTFVLNVVMPYARIFEDAMEMDLLTVEDRNAGVIIRFNLDAALRGDFKSRQEGLKIQREMGVINADDWREMENMNPIGKANGGEDYWRQGPSGQTAAAPDGSEPDPNDPGAGDPGANPDNGDPKDDA